MQGEELAPWPRCVVCDEVLVCWTMRRRARAGAVPVRCGAPDLDRAPGMSAVAVTTVHPSVCDALDDLIGCSTA